MNNGSGGGSASATMRRGFIGNNEEDVEDADVDVLSVSTPAAKENNNNYKDGDDGDDGRGEGSLNGLALVNPFVHKLYDGTPMDHIQTALFTLLLLPFRVIIIALLLLVAWLLACIGLYGMTLEDLAKRPLTGWRKKVQLIAAAVMRLVFVAGTFHRVKCIGRRATAKEAPIICVAPHSSFFDSIVTLLMEPPSVVAKGETAQIPFIGKLINFTQPIYVWREDPNSRQNTIKAIIERANSQEDWPQIIIFPEGTCTNRSCLITFKPGAFYPAVPIQPVIIRYPNRLDSFTWTWSGPGVLTLLWLTLTKVFSNCEVEFMPVYVPTEEEKQNPKLYAKNVRLMMSKALNIPVSDYTYNDCKILSRAREMNLPRYLSIVEVEKLRVAIGLSQTNIEERVITSGLVNDANNQVNFIEFCLRLQIHQNSISQRLFTIFEASADNCGQIDFREYLTCASFIINYKQMPIRIIAMTFMMYEDNEKVIGREAFREVLGRTMRVKDGEEADRIYKQVQAQQQQGVTFNQFVAYAESKAEYSYLFRVPKDVAPDAVERRH